MDQTRKIISINSDMTTMEGAGVRLKRVFGFHQAPGFDPFLLLDHFGSDDPRDYIKGFPWHPHRGIETVTYMISGEVEHGDSIGNNGVIRSGDVQWMTAGSGIIHQEMPRAHEGRSMGFQLWVNLPKKEKMTTPRYRGLTKADFTPIKVVGGEIIVIAGNYNGTRGPVEDLFVDTEYFDIHLDGIFEHSTNKRTAFVYVYEGSITIEGQKVESGHCARLEENGDVLVRGKGRFIFVAGDPLDQPIAWGGPIVMNTQEEIETAFRELNDGTFIKK